MQMSQQQCDLHVDRLRNAPHLFSGVVTLNSRGAVVFCASGTNGGLVNADCHSFAQERAGRLIPPGVALASRGSGPRCGG